MTTFIGVDPGETTGVVVWDDANGYGEFAWCAELGHTFAIPAIRPFVDDDTIIACERFVIASGTVRKKRGPTPELVGALRALAQERGARFIVQTASDAKNLATNDLLERIGWKLRGKRHATDAARHLLLAVAKNRPKIFAELVDI